MKVRIVCYEDPDLWILGKFAKNLKINLQKLGHDAEIVNVPDPLADINHHIIFNDYNGKKNLVDTLMITHIDNIVVKKTWFPGKRSEVNLVNSHEYVLYFCNGNVWKLDRLPVRQHMNTESSVTCPGNTWEVETGSLDEAYSVELAELLIRMTDCLPGSVVFDPYGGGTASLKAALKLGHSFFGFEKDEKQLKKCEKLVKEHHNEK
jgi:hypothetical protein